MFFKGVIVGGFTMRKEFSGESSLEIVLQRVLGRGS